MNTELLATDLKINEFQIYSDEILDIFYVPFGCINDYARLMIVGLTPGWTQMKIAFQVFAEGLKNHKSIENIFLDVEKTASFAGSMRANLVQMLNELDIPKYMNIESSDALFSSQYELVHTTSILRYPVFVDGKNYTGHKPKILKHYKLKETIDQVFTEELRLVPNALIIPQGKAVSEVLIYLIEQGLVEDKRCILNFPHASGANGHRKKQFYAYKEAMRQKIGAWFHR